ncbi:uncharacterized protein Z520_01792 [Fonsecaea multimorphosa CBS 102226]|uniref:C2H2-type domain-containing protein n=1 Tax=Fonsecaea multimorphosa CBS 102226 TaxID=1442371 RepID=A0A0D2HIA8_9EURO|nr:uncharacterized protein Z520_01792 [Fonsecaea multimorphosa CBS 102226]KIY01656.1 hypothetical protein Z520_01792 [Fonsecaea multimorphosa CBS 102226]
MKIKCTYEDCFKHFDTHQAMILHKVKDPEHSYCKLCDVDCADDMFLFIHQLGSPAHICCPICGSEFKSPIARDSHMDTHHRYTQNIECAGCQQKFRSAADLMQHIERDECPTIKLQDFQMQRAERQIQKDAWEAETDPFAINPPTWDQTSAASNNARPDLLGMSTDDSGRSLSNARGGPISTESHEQFPPLSQKMVNASAAPPQSSSGQKPTGDLDDLDRSAKAMSNLQISQPACGMQQNTDTRQENISGGMVKGWLNSVSATLGPPSDDSTEVASMYDRRASSSETPGTIPPSSQASPNQDAPHKHIIQMPAHSIVSTSSRLDHEKYWDSIRQVYSCPTIKCKRQFRTLAEFQQHLLSSAHIGGQVTCPSCLKRFATTAAWVAHTASASKRCDIRNSANFNQVMRELTGGLLGTQGYNDNGSVKFVAPKIEDW